MGALLEYECRVPVGGYEVVTIDAAMPFEPPHQNLSLGPLGYEKRMLRARSERTKRFNLFEVHPSATPAFLELAKTPDSEDAITEFADRYGPLFENDDDPIIVRGGGYRFHWGLLIDDWSRAIRQMHQTIELWEMSRRTGDFRKLVRAAMRRGNRDTLAPIVTLGVPVHLTLKEDTLSGFPRLCIRPENLHEALWAQLLLAIDGNVNLGACVQCRKWFTLEAGRGRSDKEYCSNACRMRAYRKRKGSGVNQA